MKLWCEENNEDDVLMDDSTGMHEKAVVNLYEDIRCLKEDIGVLEARYALLDKAYKLARNSAAGLTNYCEHSASVRRCEKELEQAETIYREILLTVQENSK